MRYFKYLLIITGISLWFWGINYPFAGMDNANNNYLMLAARNFVRFGFLRLRFNPTYFAGHILPAPIPFYLHHPVLIFSLSALPLIMFEFHNWGVHGANLLFLFGDIVMIYAIGSLVWNNKVGLWAAGLAAIFPMTTFFWKYIFFEQGSMFFNLLIFYFVYKYSKRSKNIVSPVYFSL